MYAYVLIYNTHTHIGVHMCILSHHHVQHFATLRTAACHAPLSTDSLSKNTRLGSHFLSPEALPGIEPVSPAAPELAGGLNH